MLLYLNIIISKDSYIFTKEAIKKVIHIIDGNYHYPFDIGYHFELLVSFSLTSTNEVY